MAWREMARRRRCAIDSVRAAARDRRQGVSMNRSMIAFRGLVVALVLGAASAAMALPVTLKDSNGTKYNVNTQVSPLLSLSNASGAVTNATFVQPVTVTSYYVAFTPFLLFLTTYTVQHQINVPLTPAFNGFNGLLISSVN